MGTYSMADLVGKTMIARKKCVSRSLPSSNSEIYEEYNTGDTIGKVYSYVKKNGITWLMFDAPNNKSYYFDLSQPNVIDKPALSEQGVLTGEEKQIIEAENSKGVFEKIYDSIFKLLLFASAIYLLKSVIDKQ